MRQRRQQQQQQAQTPRHPALRQQPHPPIMTSQTVPRPTRSSQPRIALPPSQPLPSPNDEGIIILWFYCISIFQLKFFTAPFRLPQPPAVTTQFPPHHTTQFIPPGMCLGPAPGPPQPSPILPRDRTNLDKVQQFISGHYLPNLLNQDTIYLTS